jgi:hypothetical protein
VCAEEPVAPRVHTAPDKTRHSWWSGWWTPAFAAGLGVFAAYQGLVVIPGLRGQMHSRAMAPIVLLPAARGLEQPVEVAAADPYQNVSLDVNNVEPDTAITYELVAPGGEVRVSSPTKAPPLGSPLIVTLWHTDLVRPGNWTLVLRDSQRHELSSYPFLVPK